MSRGDCPFVPSYERGSRWCSAAYISRDFGARSRSAITAATHARGPDLPSNSDRTRALGYDADGGDDFSSDDPGHEC